MSRIRSVHPRLFTDEAFMQASPYARLFFIGLWTECFDDGLFEWKPLTLKARLCPADNLDISAVLDELTELNFIRRFEIEGKIYGAVRNFCKFQRPKKPNGSGVVTEEASLFTGYSPTSSPPVPHQFPIGGEKSQQKGGREEGRKEGREEEEADASLDLVFEGQTFKVTAKRQAELLSAYPALKDLLMAELVGIDGYFARKKLKGSWPAIHGMLKRKNQEVLEARERTKIVAEQTKQGGGSNGPRIIQQARFIT